MTGEYSNPTKYWDDRAKASGITSPGQAGTAMKDDVTLKTIDQIGQFEMLLDFGCGTGRLYSTLSNHCKQYWGVDFSAEMLKLFAKHHKRRKFDFLLQANLSLPLAARGGLTIKPEVMDAAVSNMVLQHILDPKEFNQAVLNLKQLVKKGGMLYIHEFMMDAITWEEYSHITCRPVSFYQEAFKPEFNLQVQKSHIQHHTFLAGEKL